MKTKLTWCFACGGVAVLFVVVALVYRHAIVTRTARLASIREQVRTIENGPTRAELTQVNEALRQEIKATVGRDLATVYDNLTDRLNNINAADTSITNTGGEAVGSLQRVPLRVSFRGSFTDVFKLTDQLRQDDALLRLQRLEITREPAGTATELAITMQFEAYIATEKD